MDMSTQPSGIQSLTSTNHAHGINPIKSKSTNSCITNHDCHALSCNPFVDWESSLTSTNQISWESPPRISAQFQDASHQDPMSIVNNNSVPHVNATNALNILNGDFEFDSLSSNHGNESPPSPKLLWCPTNPRLESLIDPPHHKVLGSHHMPLSRSKSASISIRQFLDVDVPILQSSKPSTKKANYVASKSTRDQHDVNKVSLEGRMELSWFFFSCSSSSSSSSSTSVANEPLSSSLSRSSSSSTTLSSKESQRKFKAQVKAPEHIVPSYEIVGTPSTKNYGRTKSKNNFKDILKSIVSHHHQCPPFHPQNQKTSCNNPTIGRSSVCKTHANKSQSTFISTSVFPSTTSKLFPSPQHAKHHQKQRKSKCSPTSPYYNKSPINDLQRKTFLPYRPSLIGC